MPIQLHTKHWSDRADRDLFFSILSVKNIGTISGSEWNVIGSDMRTLGYGFTNEGCRQHFQGLRRSIIDKKKTEGVEAGEALPSAGQRETAETAETETQTASASLTTSLTTSSVSSASLGSLPNGIDPTRNPITRRPGPGRGRPRKQKGDASKNMSSTAEEPSAELLAAANGLRPLLPASGSSGKSGVDEAVGAKKAAPASTLGKRRREPQLQMQAQTQTQIQTQAQPLSQPVAQHQSLAPLPAAVPASLSVDNVSAAWATFDNASEHHQEQEPGDGNGQPNKRQRLDAAPSAVPAASAPAAMPPSLAAAVQDDAVFAALADNDAAFSEDFPFEV